MKKKAKENKEMELIYTPTVATTEAQEKEYQIRVDNAYRILFEEVEKKIKEEKKLEQK